MAISKEQPMRPTLNDCVDFLNNNLDVQSVEQGINAINARVDELSQELHQTLKLRAVSATVDEVDMPQHHLIVDVQLPEGVTANDIISYIPSGSIYRLDDIAYSAITVVNLAYTRFINWFYDEDTNIVHFHWYPTATTSTELKPNHFTYTGTVIYIERN